MIVTMGETQGIGCGVLTQSLGIAQNVAAQGLTGVHERFELVEDDF